MSANQSQSSLLIFIFHAKKENLKSSWTHILQFLADSLIYEFKTKPEMVMKILVFQWQSSSRKFAIKQIYGVCIKCSEFNTEFFKGKISQLHLSKL